jgi:hypothetical protein
MRVILQTYALNTDKFKIAFFKSEAFELYDAEIKKKHLNLNELGMLLK